MNELISPWMGYASIPMYDDGVITWWANKKSDYIGTALYELEQDLGINFERVESKKDAEIRHKRVKEIWNGGFSSGNVLGLASWKPSDKVWKLKTKIGKQFDSTVIHELGHALGLDHPESHDTTKNTVMSYNRDRAINRFYYKDLDVLNAIYIEEDYVLQDVVSKEVKIDMILGECFRNEHQKKKHGKHSLKMRDELTGIEHVDYI